MRNLALINGLVLIVACADTSNVPHPSGAAGGGSGSGGFAQGASGGAPGGVNHGTGAGGAGGSGGTTGGSGASGQSGAGGAGGVRGSGGDGSGGQTERDAGQGGAGGRGATDAGADASTGKTCDDFAMEYAAALDAAKNCNAQASAQCQQVVPAGPSCRRCTTHVNDASMLNAIQKQYDQAGCPNNPCMGVLCVNPGNGDCVPIDRGDVCQ